MYGKSQLSFTSHEMVLSVLTMCPLTSGVKIYDVHLPTAQVDVLSIVLRNMDMSQL